MKLKTKKKGIIKVIFLMIFLFYVVFGMFSQEKIHIVIDEKANIYLNPSANSPIIENVEKGTALTLKSLAKIKGSWYHVYSTSSKKRNSTSGYVLASSVEEVSKIQEIGERKKRAAVISLYKAEEDVMGKVEILGVEGDKIRVHNPETSFLDSSGEIQKKVKSKKKGKKKVSKKKRRTKAKPPSVQKRIYQVKVGMNYFIPSEKAFKDIYGAGLMYMGEIGIGIWKNLDLCFWGSYFSKKGKLTFTKEETKFEIIPIGGGFKYWIPTGNLNFYLAGGLSYFFFKEKNPIGNVSESKLGYDAKIGSILELSRGLIIDFFINYSYCSTKVDDFKANIGGLKTGIGFGYKF